MKSDKISHISMNGVEINFDRIMFMSSINGIPDRKITPVANNLRLFKRLKIPNRIHAYTIEISDILHQCQKQLLHLAGHLICTNKVLEKY